MARKLFSVYEVVSKLQADDNDGIEQFSHKLDANNAVVGANRKVDIVILPPDNVMSFPMKRL